MNYKESSEILSIFKNSNKIVINCHRSPDPDSVGSAVAMHRLLKLIGKDSDLICVDEIPRNSSFLNTNSLIKKVDYQTFDFSIYDTFLILDSSNWQQVSGNLAIKIPDIRKINIDHHFTNDKFGDINIIDALRSSTAEVLYNLISDFDIKMTPEVAEALLTGLIYDTSSLQNPSADLKTSEIFSDLIRLGANKDKIVENIYRSLSFEQVKAASEILSKFEIDREHHFVWSAVSFEEYKKFESVQGVKTLVANLFGSSIDDTDFGLIMVEEQEKTLNISFRARTDFDTSLIAHELGGGGHKKASAVRIMGLPFDQAVLKVLEVCRKYANSN